MNLIFANDNSAIYDNYFTINFIRRVKRPIK